MLFMHHALHFMFLPRPSSRTSRLLGLMACLLVAIRLVAGVVCSTCFNEFEQPSVESFHLHGGGDHEACHHGRAEASPLIVWACLVNQDDPAFLLPEIPQLPAILSLAIPLVLLLISFRSVSLIAAQGRGPPVSDI
jgi:hypothetical protein